MNLICQNSSVPAPICPLTTESSRMLGFPDLRPRPSPRSPPARPERDTGRSVAEVTSRPPVLSSRRQDSGGGDSQLPVPLPPWRQHGERGGIPPPSSPAPRGRLWLSPSSSTTEQCYFVNSFPLLVWPAPRPPRYLPSPQGPLGAGSA